MFLFNNINGGDLMADKNRKDYINPITEFASIFVSDERINKQTEDMFDRSLPPLSIRDLFNKEGDNESNGH